MSELEQQQAIVKKIHVEMGKMVNEQQDLLDENRALKGKNKVLAGKIKDLKGLLSRWEFENKVLQESLEQCQRELMDK